MGLILPAHKTKIVCTIGPASRSDAVLDDLLRRGMNVARLNFAHGTPDEHRDDIRRIRAAAARCERPCLIFADLPGPKIRIGALEREPLLLRKGDRVTLTTRAAPGTAERISVDYPRLPESVEPGNVIYLNDGFIQLHVRETTADTVVCEVSIGGPLLSHKGLKLPGARIFPDAVTDSDLAWVEFALDEGLDAFGVSFVEDAEDVRKVRDFAAAKGKAIRVIAKIERAEAVRNLDAILDAADAVMVARGDLGVEIPIEDVPAVQKDLIRQANLRGRPVITATQMLLSMTENIRPTRAEASDVANAILDGTDAVMLSEETAIGKYPVEAVDMMARIAASIERKAPPALPRELDRARSGRADAPIEDVVSFQVAETARALGVRCIVTATLDGGTPRCVSRFKPPCWIFAFCTRAYTQRFLTLSYGVYPVLVDDGAGSTPERMLESLGAANLIEAGDTVLVAGEATREARDRTDALRIVQFRPAG